MDAFGNEAQPRITMKGGELVKIEEVQGPSISGSVTVPLSELDKLRADHAKAADIARKLIAHQAEVKVTVIQQYRGSTMVYDTVKDRLGRVIDQKARMEERWKDAEVHVEYKNIEDFREIIRQEEYEKLANELASITKSHDAAVKKATEDAGAIGRLLNDSKAKDLTIEELDKINTGFKQRLELADQERLSSNTQIEELIDRVKHDRQEHDKHVGSLKTQLAIEKESKGFWFNLFKLFGVK